MILEIEIPWAFGLIEALWHVTAEQAPAGDIGRLSNQDIAMEMFYTRDADALIEAFKRARLIDENSSHRLVVHDWSQHSDDATDLKVARNIGAYADGKPPRLTRLSKAERDRILASNAEKFRSYEGKATQSHGKPHKATNSSEKPLPDPVPGPDPVPDPDPEPKALCAMSVPAVIDPNFDEWWNGWSSVRGTNHKPQAQQAWVSVVRPENVVALFECTVSYLASLDSPTKGYNPENFLFEQSRDGFAARWPPRQQREAAKIDIATAEFIERRRRRHA